MKTRYNPNFKHPEYRKIILDVYELNKDAKDHITEVVEYVKIFNISGLTVYKKYNLTTGFEVWHNLRGPAFIYSDGTKEYWIEGEEYPYKEWLEERKRYVQEK